MNPNDPQRPQPPQPQPQQPQPIPPAGYYPPIYPQPGQPVQPGLAGQTLQPGQTPAPQAFDPTQRYFQPTQPAVPGNEQPAADFGFITNPDKPAAKLNHLAGGSTLQRALFAVGGLALLVIIGVIIASIIGGGKPNTTLLLNSVAQQQTEVNRVAKLGATGATTYAMRGAAVSVQLSSLTARGNVSGYLATNKEKLNPKLLASKQNAKTDAALQAGTANNTFNSTFAEVMTVDLNNYMASLKTAYDANPGPKGQAMLKAQYSEAQLLSKQIANAASSSIDG